MSFRGSVRRVDLLLAQPACTRKLSARRMPTYKAQAHHCQYCVTLADANVRAETK
jgi:hypothetical protein